MNARKIVLLVFLASAFVVRGFAQNSVDTLREVVITGTGTEHLLKNAPVQTEVISRRVLDSFGAKSMEEILGSLTASFAFNEGDMGSQMQLNGLGNSYILILIDGKRIHGDVGGENDLSLIDPHNIDHIEIVKGAQSALYGSDAIAGVINIITKKHHDEGLYLENVTRYGSYNDVRQHNGIGVTSGKWSSMTNFQLQHSDGWQNTAEEYTEAMVVNDSRNKTVNKFTNWQIAERLTYQPVRNVDLYADGMYYTKGIYRPQNGRYPSCDVYTYDLMYRNASASVGGKWKVNTSGVVTFDVDWNKHAYYYMYTATTLTDGYDPNGNFTNYFPYFSGQKNLQSDQQRVMANLKGVFQLPYKNQLSAGLEYRYDYLNAPMRTATGTADDWTCALYAQDEFDWVKWFNLTTGLRIIENGGFGFHVTPKVSTMFSLGDFRLRLGWSQGFKSPDTKQLHYRYLHTMGSSTFFNMGNTSLDAQTSNYWSAGLEYRGERLTISATGYLNVLDNMITLVNVPVSEIPKDVTTSYLGDGSGEVVARQYRNMEDAKTYGVDVNVGYKINREFSLGGNYNYLDTEAHVYNSDHNRLDKVTIDGMAHHKWNAYVVWSHRFVPVYKLGLNLSTRGSSERFYQNNGNGKPFQIWRFNTTHDFGREEKNTSYRVEMGMDNILGYVDRTIHPYHLGTTNAGRTVYATFSIKFRQGKRFINLISTKKQTDYDED